MRISKNAKFLIIGEGCWHGVNCWYTAQAGSTMLGFSVAYIFTVMDNTLRHSKYVLMKDMLFEK